MTVKSGAMLGTTCMPNNGSTTSVNEESPNGMNAVEAMMRA